MDPGAGVGDAHGTGCIIAADEDHQHAACADGDPCCGGSAKTEATTGDIARVLGGVQSGIPDLTIINGSNVVAPPRIKRTGRSCAGCNGFGFVPRIDPIAKEAGAVADPFCTFIRCTSCGGAGELYEVA